jgi:hypothetical protein
MPATVVTTPVESAKHLIDLLLDMEPGAIFRGHSDSNWPLRPSAWREGVLDRYRDQIARSTQETWLDHLPGQERLTDTDAARKYIGDQPGDITRLKELVDQLIAERYVVSNFAAACDRVALVVPGLSDADSVWSRLEDVIHFQTPTREGRKLAEPVPTYPVSTQYAFAQHHRLPTRILDFSDSPFKAAFFAAEGVRPIPLMNIGRARPEFSLVAARPPPTEGFRDLVLLGYDTKVLRVLRSQIPYLHAQDGLFISCNAVANKYFLDNGRWPDLEEVMHGWRLEKFVLPADAASDLLVRLARIGIDANSLSPSFENIAKKTRRLCNIPGN